MDIHRPSLPGAAARVAHAVAVLAGWLAFISGWVWALREPHADWLIAAWVIGLSALVWPALTLGWVRHNLGLHRRFGDRRRGQRATIEQAYPVDWVGRRVTADFRQLRTQPLVVISSSSDTKTFRAVDPFAS